MRKDKIFFGYSRSVRQISNNNADVFHLSLIDNALMLLTDSGFLPSPECCGRWFDREKKNNQQAGMINVIVALS